MTDLVLYKDRKFTIPFTIEDLGDVEAGDIRIIEGYLYNSTPNSIIQIDYEVPDEDVEVLEVPPMLEGEAWSKVEIKYAPDKLRTTPLNTFVTFTGKRRIPPD